jgi:hypothetical protein
VEAEGGPRAFAEDAQAHVAPVAAARGRGDGEAARVPRVDGSAGRPGCFATQSATTQPIERDNVHTRPRLLQQTPPLAAARQRAHLRGRRRTNPARAWRRRACCAGCANRTWP